MSLRQTRTWWSARTPAELAALASGAVVFGWIGWDLPLWDARLQLVLHLVAIAAIAGLVLAAVRGAALPRTPIDVALLALLATFALATVSALNVGMSQRAMAAIVATAAMLPVALFAVRHRPSWVGLVTALPVLVLSVPTLGMLLARRIEWMLVGAPGLPPLRLLGEGTVFGSVAVPPFVIWPAWALAGLIQSGPWRRGVRIGLVAVGIPLTILSGSRSAWLAAGVTLLVAGAPWAWRQRHRLRVPRRPTLRGAVVAAGALAVVVIGLLLVVPRLTAITSLVYRASLWRDTLAAWSTDPLLGIGPGFMPYARQAAAPDFSFPVRQPHSHNLPLGVLGDAGLLGLAAAVLLVVSIAVVAGPWRSRTATGRGASVVLLGLAVGGLFEDLTFLPNFNLLAIVLVAVALTDAGAVTWVRPRSWGPARRMGASAGGGLIAAALLPAMVVADAGAISHRHGVDAAADGRWNRAAIDLVRAMEIDPWHPAPPKALTVAADAAGDTGLARHAAAIATARHPGDGPSWVNLAILCGELDDPRCRLEATDRAVATASFLGTELVNAAFSYDALELTAEADDAYRRSLLSQRLTALATDWRQVPVRERTLDEDFGALFEFNRLLAWWAMDEPIDPARFDHPAIRGLAHAMRGDRSRSAALLAEAAATLADDPITWEIVIVVRDHWGEPVEREQRIRKALVGSAIPPRTRVSAGPGLSLDLASFRAYPGDELVAAAVRLGTDPPYPWSLARTLP